jgi:hypothetical protein
MATSEVDVLRSKVARQRNEIMRLEQVVARLAGEKAELLLDVRSLRLMLEERDEMLGGRHGKVG